MNKTIGFTRNGMSSPVVFAGRIRKSKSATNHQFSLPSASAVACRTRVVGGPTNEV